MEDIVITSAVRTAVGAYLGSLKTIEAQDLAAAVIKEAVRRSSLTPDRSCWVRYTAIPPM